MEAWAIVAAGGSGERLGSPKAFRPLGGVPMVAHSLRALASAGVAGVVVVVPGGEDVVRGLRPDALVARGGATRQASVRAGLALVPASAQAVVVHDAARPLATPALFERALAALADADGAVCAIPLTDTLKRVEGGGVEGARVVETVARAGLWRAQTPQAFRRAVLVEAHERAARERFEATDDAALVERVGGTVVVVPGDERNIKITTPEDLALAEALLAGEAAPL